MLNLDEHFQVPDLIAERYTEYVDNDVDVDDVDDDEEGAGAYFFLVRHSDAHINCELH